MTDTPAFVYRTQVRFSQTDPAGYVFFPRFFEMFQAAVEDWFYEGMEIDYAAMIRGGRGLPTARTECDFMVPCRLGDQLALEVHLEKLGASSITIRFVGRVGGETRLEARSVLVMIDTENGRPIAIDDETRRRLERYRDGAAGP